MRIALLGKGKTGGKVLEILIQNNTPYTVFDSKNQPTLASLKAHDVVISFLAGEVFTDYIPLLIESTLPVVTGSTGMQWPNDFHTKLKNLNLKWIYATNFSLGMNIIHQMILVMKEADAIIKNVTFSMNEIHHTQKLDAPSGTALSWKKWLGHDVHITSERIGDVTGIHELKLTTPSEEITLRHDALDRKIFAEGALFAAEKIHTLTPGLHQFQDVVQKELLKGKN